MRPPQDFGCGSSQKASRCGGKSNFKITDLPSFSKIWVDSADVDKCGELKVKGSFGKDAAIQAKVFVNLHSGQGKVFATKNGGPEAKGKLSQGQYQTLIRTLDSKIQKGHICVGKRTAAMIRQAAADLC